MWRGSETGVEVDFLAIPLGSAGFAGVSCAEMEIAGVRVRAGRRRVGRIGAMGAVKARERFEFLSGGLAETVVASGVIVCKGRAD